MRVNSRKPGGLYPVREESRIDAEVKAMLTTVCIKTGVVRIPHRHQAVFQSTNYSFELDGLPLSIEYDKSGQLIGMKDLLQEAGVRPNDALVISLTGGVAAISFETRERKAPVAAIAAMQKAGRADAEKPDKIKAIRKVRINTQQYYPLETVPVSALLESEDEVRSSEAPRINVTARQRRLRGSSSEQGVSRANDRGVEAPASPAIGEGRRAYQVSEDFERWIASSDSTDQGSSGSTVEKEKLQEPGSAIHGGNQVRSPKEILQAVERFISRPDTPAIIQTQKVADALQMNSEQCELALQRISEDHERVSRIRDGAYMIRQKRSTTKV